MHYHLVERNVLVEHIESAGLQRHVRDLLHIGQSVGIGSVRQQGNVCISDLLICVRQQLLGSIS